MIFRLLAIIITDAKILTNTRNAASCWKFNEPTALATICQGTPAFLRTIPPTTAMQVSSPKIGDRLGTGGTILS